MNSISVSVDKRINFNYVLDSMYGLDVTLDSLRIDDQYIHLQCSCDNDLNMSLFEEDLQTYEEDVYAE